MNLSTRATNSYRRSLKAWMGYVAEGHRASNFETSAVTALGWLVEDDSAHLEDFLSRYRVSERDRRRGQVRKVVLQWLAEFAE